MTVRELIGGEIVWIEPSSSLHQAAIQMHDSDVGALAVETNGALVGIITERDLVRACATNVDFDASRVKDWMTPNPDSLGPEMSVGAAATWMVAAGYRHLPVVEGGRAIGVVSIKDILWALTEPTVA
jgi:CBS domain-containing protein